MIRYILFFCFLLMASLSACKKDSSSNNGCSPGTATARYITNSQATIKATGGQFFIVEKDAIDTRLAPCSLAANFQVNDLPVTISGEVKVASHGGDMPCCTNNFVISKISR